MGGDNSGLALGASFWKMERGQGKGGWFSRGKDVTASGPDSRGSWEVSWPYLLESPSSQRPQRVGWGRWPKPAEINQRFAWWGLGPLLPFPALLPECSQLERILQAGYWKNLFWRTWRQALQKLKLWRKKVSSNAKAKMPTNPSIHPQATFRPFSELWKPQF